VVLKALIQSYRMESGMYEIECQPFPQFLEPKSELIGHLCYFLEPYEPTGFSIAYTLIDGVVGLKVLDDAGNDILIDDLNSQKRMAFDANVGKFLGLCGILKIKSCQAFFTFVDGNSILADVYTPHKFIGPGMLNDIFSRAFTTPKVIKTAAYKEDGTETNVVIKPSKFMTVMIDGNPTPLYVKK